MLGRFGSRGTSSLVVGLFIVAGVLLLVASVCVSIAVVSAHRTGRRAPDRPMPHARQLVVPQHPAQPLPVLVQMPVHVQAPVHVHPYVTPAPWQQGVVAQAQPRSLQRAWPGVAEALDQHLRREEDPVERMRVTVDLGGLGGSRPAQLLVDAVRDGVISPTAGAQAVARTGFAGGVIAGAASYDPDPRVRTFARMVIDGSARE